MKTLLRPVLCAVITLGLRLRSRRYVPPPGARCLIIAPHQDDESLGCAGLVLAHRQAGLPVAILYITDGSMSHPGHPFLAPADIARLRRAEALQAASLLGVPPADLHFLDATDGRLPHLDPAENDALTRRLSAQLSALHPSLLCLPCRRDGSSEHTAAFALVMHALRLAALSPRILEYPVWARWNPFRLLRPGLASRRVWRLAFPHALATKRAALAAYATQIAPVPPWPHPVLPPGFLRCFASPEEFFFEHSPAPSPRLNLLRRLRRRFIDAPRGLGHPVPAEAFDAEFRSGHWRLLDSSAENIRYDTLATLVRDRHARPRLLDAGCGSGRLAACFHPGELACYHGVDLSDEAVRLARQNLPPSALLRQADLETWQPSDSYDVIVVNEVVGYFRDPSATLSRLASSLAPGGAFIVSLYRWGHSPAIWRRIDTRFRTLRAAAATSPAGDKTWDLRILVPAASPAHA